MKIPLVDLKAQLETIRSEIYEAIGEVVESTAFVKGPHTKKFENEFAAFVKASHCIGVGNGTDALEIALRSLGVSAGDEVIVPAMSFISTAEAVTTAGGKVVFADIDPQTKGLDPAKLKAAITPKTKGMIVVHLYGCPANMEELKAVADEHGLWILEDCAQAHAAHIGGQHVGTFGDISSFSFFPGKNLGAYGDAGAIVTSNEELALKVRMEANHGRVGKYDHEFEGRNSRLDSIQGAVLSVKLPRLLEWTEKRREVAGCYRIKLQQLAEKGLLKLPADIPGHAYHLFVVETPKRDSLLEYLHSKGVGAGVHYPIALHNMKAYEYLHHKPDDFPVADALSQQCLSLPIYAELTDLQLDYICKEIINFFS
jgi:dTDP-4-amino-4,6-dideoxygalactose transaminase